MADTVWKERLENTDDTWDETVVNAVSYNWDDVNRDWNTMDTTAWKVRPTI